MPAFTCAACLYYRNCHPGRACFVPSQIAYHAEQAYLSRSRELTLMGVTATHVYTPYNGRFPSWQSVRDYRREQAAVQPQDRVSTCDACGDPDVVGLEFQIPDEGIQFLCDACIIRRFMPESTGGSSDA